MINPNEYNIDLILDGALFQMSAFFLLLFFLVVFFEIIPIFFGVKNNIKKNFVDFVKYQIIRGVYTFFLGGILMAIFIYTKTNIGLINITDYSTISQIIIIYFFGELIIYISHLLAHRYKIPLLSKSHAFHHTIKHDMDWVNSKKEHYLILSLFTFVFCILFFVIFKSSYLSHIFVTCIYFTLNAFSHYRIPLTVNILNYVFLFPKEHLQHHTKRGGPYGVTLSLFDTIFDTKN